MISDREVTVWSENKQEVVAQIFNLNLKNEKYNFFTDQNAPIQLGLVNFLKNEAVEAHKHNDIEKRVTNAVEGWLVVSGSFEAEFWCNEKKKIHCQTILPNDLVLTFSGYHAIKATENNSSILEIRNGPYFGKDLEIKCL